MKYLYVGSFVEPSQEDYIINQGHSVITASTTTFQRAFLSGFANKEIKPIIFNCPDIGSWPKRSKLVHVPASFTTFHSLPCHNASYYNITYFKRYSIYYNLKKRLVNWLKTHPNEKVTIIVYALIYPYIKAAVDIKKQFPNVEVCCIVLDLPEFFGDSDSWLSSFLFSPKNTYELVDHIDSFILLTKFMAERLNVGNRPWLLMEGIYEPKHFDVNSHYKQKAVLYTGKLDKRFGIRNLVDSFMRISNIEIELWICGGGSDEDYVKSCTEKDSRIKYFGFLHQSKVFELQRKASLLINPRSPEGEYTRYSFPSKTMEYMASGTPTIMYNLECIPDEYKPFLILMEAHDDMSKVIGNWLSKSESDLYSFGKKAQNFILENKTADKQIGHLINFFNQIN